MTFAVQAGEPAAPPLLMIALPMDASGFATLAGHFGTGRS
jgi:hypothetical protein